MKIKTFSHVAGLSLASICVYGEAGLAQNQKKPNIIVILADDMGYSDISCFGSEISTPNLDRLAKNGVRFTQFYNASRSCPTRASLLTGLYQHQAGVGDMVDNKGIPAYQGFLNTQCVTLGEAMKVNGYNTYMSGKWHVGNKPQTLPRKRGFDHYFGLIDGASSYFQLIPYRNNQQAPKMMLDDEPYFPESGFYMTNAITDYALTFLEEETPKKEPFFMYLAYTAPHWPLHALPNDIEKYRGTYMKGWDESRKERFEKMHKLGIIDASVKLTPRDEKVPAWETLSMEDKKMWDLRMAVYAAMIHRLDQNIGRVIEKLEEMGELDNTVIVFLSDNGGCHEGIKNQGNYIRTTGETGNIDSFDAYEFPWANVSNTPFRMHKHWVHEGGISAPFIFHYPARVKGGKIVKEAGHIIDIMPTLLDFANGRYPSTYNGNKITGMEGISLLPAIEGKPVKRKNPLIWEHEGNRALRLGNWKLVSQYDYSKKQFMKWELYNMKSDRAELDDLADKESAIAGHLMSLYEQHAARIGVVSKESLDKK